MATLTDDEKRILRGLGAGMFRAFLVGLKEARAAGVQLAAVIEKASDADVLEAFGPSTVEPLEPGLRAAGPQRQEVSEAYYRNLSTLPPMDQLQNGDKIFKVTAANQDGETNLFYWIVRANDTGFKLPKNADHYGTVTK